MPCDVCIGGDYGDYDGYAEFSSCVDRKARKDYKCCECRAEIPKGTRHQVYSGKFDGDVFTERTCLACAEIRQVYSCDEMQPAFCSLWEEFRERGAFEHLKMAGECWDKLTAVGKEKLLAQWRKWKGLDQPAKEGRE